MSANTQILIGQKGGSINWNRLKASKKQLVAIFAAIQEKKIIEKHLELVARVLEGPLKI
jgi:hypothetical protein